MRKVPLVALVVVFAMPAVAQGTSTIDVERTPDVTAWGPVAKAAASSGLDFHWNDDYSTYSIFMSFLGADNAVHVLRLKNFSWYDTVVQEDFSGSSAYPPKISAQGDTVIVAYTHTFAYGRGVKYMISYDAGDTWASGAIATPADGEGSYCRHDISARGGLGILSAQQQELGFVDAMHYRYRPSYVDPIWNDQERFNDWEVATGGEVEVNFLGPDVGFGDVPVTTSMLSTCHTTQTSGRSRPTFVDHDLPSNTIDIESLMRRRRHTPINNLEGRPWPKASLQLASGRGKAHVTMSRRTTAQYRRIRTRQ